MHRSLVAHLEVSILLTSVTSGKPRSTISTPTWQRFWNKSLDNMVFNLRFWMLKRPPLD